MPNHKHVKMKKNDTDPNARGEAFEEMLRRATQEDDEDRNSTDNEPEKQPEKQPEYKADAETEAEENTPQKQQNKGKEGKKNGKEGKKQRARKIFKQFADEDDEFDMSLRSWLGGDMLASRKFRRQIGYVILLSVLAIIYVSSRYAYQQEEIRHEDLSKQLIDRKFKALTISSELTEYSMRSSVEENLTDTTLRTSTQSSYYLPVDSTNED